MAQQQMCKPQPPAGLRQHPVTRRPRPRGQARPLRQIVQHQDLRGDAARAQAGLGCRRLDGGGRTQPVIDDQAGDAPAPFARPGIGQQRQGQTVRAARDGHRKMRRRR